jgi:maleamate amidohydrolase
MISQENIRWVREFLTDDDIRGYEYAGMSGRMGLGHKPAVLVVDLFNMCVDESYPLSNGPAGRSALARTAQLLEFVRTLSIPIVYVQRAERRLPAQIGVAALKWSTVTSPRLASDPRVDEWPPEIAPQSHDLVIRKPKNSAFFETPLYSQLTFLQVDTVIVTGVSTSGCVRATVVDAFARNFRIIVPEECCGDRSQFAPRANLLDMQM